MRHFFLKFMRCCTPTFVRRFSPTISTPPLSSPPSIPLSVPLAIPPFIWLERAKQGSKFNKELFVLTAGVLVLCSFVIGNHWRLKIQLDTMKERQKELLAKLEGQTECRKCELEKRGMLDKDQIETS